MENEKKIFTLSSVAIAIEKVINTHCNKTIWVKAEIVKLNYYKQSGHCYPDLVEKKDGKVIAEMRANIWSSAYEQINAKFKSVLNEELGDNMVIVCLGTVKYSPVHGLSLNITDIDPSYTLGELARQKAETIKKLKELNLFTLNKQRVLPRIPKTIAIISVESSKGYRDFLSVIETNPWSYKFHYFLFPSILQGERAVTSIISQLDRIKNYVHIFDAVAIIRGGGGDIGLSSYDDFTLAKTIATFPIPVLTGIGHSTNETVTEMISYRSFITPTKIAEFLIQQYHNFSVPLKESIVKINNYSKSLFEKQLANIKDSARLFNSITNRLLDNQKLTLIQNKIIIENYCSSLLSLGKQNLKNNANIIQVSTSKFIQFQNQSLQTAINLLKQTKEKILYTEKTLMISIEKSISSNIKISLDKVTIELGYIKDKIILMSPLNILKRGFSITRVNGKSIKSTIEVKMNDTLETEMYEGKLQSHVEKIQNNKNILIQCLKK